MIPLYRAVVFLLECTKLEFDPICFHTEDLLDTEWYECYSLHRQMCQDLPDSDRKRAHETTVSLRVLETDKQRQTEMS